MDLKHLNFQPSEEFDRQPAWVTDKLPQSTVTVLVKKKKKKKNFPLFCKQQLIILKAEGHPVTSTVKSPIT